MILAGKKSANSLPSQLPFGICKQIKAPNCIWREREDKNTRDNSGDFR